MKRKSKLQDRQSVTVTKRSIDWHCQNLSIYQRPDGSVPASDTTEALMWLSAQRGYAITGYVMAVSPADPNTYLVSLKNTFGGATTYVQRKDLLKRRR